jgi:hypothetical protein
MSRRHLAVAAALSFLAASSAFAQEVSILNPMAASYKLSGFTYVPPKGDGWREIGYALDSLRLVYAEQLGEGQINTRVDFTAQAFPIDQPAAAPDGAQLAQLSLQQRLTEKGDTLVAMSKVAPVEGKVPIHEYTLIVKISGEDHAEHYFVALAPDKTQYLAAKMITKDTNFREQPFFAPMLESIRSLTFESAGASSSAPTPAAPAATPPATPPAAN